LAPPATTVQEIGGGAREPHRLLKAQLNLNYYFFFLATFFFATFFTAFFTAFLAFFFAIYGSFQKKRG
jgi:hypothetical protein